MSLIILTMWNFQNEIQCEFNINNLGRVFQTRDNARKNPA